MTEHPQQSALLGELITQWRKNAGLSQTALAEALNTQQATVSKLEAGSYKLSVLQLLAILSVCGLTLSDVANEIETVLRADGVPLWERVNE